MPCKLKCKQIICKHTCHTITSKYQQKSNFLHQSCTLTLHTCRTAGWFMLFLIYNLKEQTSLNQTLNINLLILKMAKHSPKNVCVMNHFKNLVRSCRQFCYFKFLTDAQAFNFFEELQCYLSFSCEFFSLICDVTQTIP